MPCKQEMYCGFETFLLTALLQARPAVKKGADVPEPYRMKELLQDKEAMEKHAAKVRLLRLHPPVVACLLGVCVC